MIRIYGYSTFNPLKVVITAEELGLEYDYVFVDLGKRENMQEEHLARHPMGKVPVIEVDGEFLFESSAICRYLARSQGNSLYSDNLLQAGKIDQIMDTMSLHIGRWLSIFFWEELIKPKFFQQDPDPAALEEAAGFLEKQLPYLENLLSQHSFLAAGEISIADCFAYAYMTITDNTGVSLHSYPKLSAWYESMGARPAVQAAKAKVFA